MTKELKIQTGLKVAILLIISLVAFSTRLFSVIRFGIYFYHLQSNTQYITYLKTHIESVIHEFDPWFNFRTTKELVDNGFYEFVNWFDQMSWYPLGRVVGGTVYPGIMVTAALIHKFIHSINFNVDIREVCVFLAPLFSAFTAYATFLFTTEIKDESAGKLRIVLSILIVLGLLAAAFMGIAPGYISRSVAGSYDNEGIAIFLLMFTFYLWLKAARLGSVYYGSLTAIFYFYMVSAWGGYAFIINLIPLHTFTLMLMGRFDSKLYAAYNSFYVLGTLSSMVIPFVGFAPLKTSEHMAALGIFGLSQIVMFAQFVRGHLNNSQFQSFVKTLVVVVFFVGFGGLVGLTMTGYISPWTGRFYSLFDTGYAKIHIPIIASVSEHQPTPWTNFFFDLHVLIALFPAGIYLCFQELTDPQVFVIIYAVFGSYFAGVMVRLMLTLTPVVCVASAIAVSKLLDTYLVKAPVVADEPSSVAKSPKSPQLDLAKQAVKAEKGASFSLISKLAVLTPVIIVLVQFVYHCTWVTQSAYSSPSIVLASRNQDGSQFIIDDFREAYYWLRENTHPQARIMSWWDYGYQITGMANRTVLVDNNTWNNTHIATVGKAMSCSEDVAYDVMQKHDVDYALVIFGGTLGYSGDDINKFLWMIRIGEGVYPDDITERNFFTSRGEYKVDHEASQTMKDSLLYKMSYYRFNEMAKVTGGRAVDRVRGVTIPQTPIKLHTVDEAYTTKNWIVRIYEVKKPDAIGRSMNAAASFGNKRRRKKSRSTKVMA